MAPGEPSVTIKATCCRLYSGAVVPATLEGRAQRRIMALPLRGRASG